MGTAHDGQVELARDMAHLLDIHFGNAPDPLRRQQFRPLSPGCSAVLMPSGGSLVHIAGEPARMPSSPSEMEAVPPPPPGSYADPRSLLGVDLVGLPFGFMPGLLRASGPRTASVGLIRTPSLAVPGERIVAPHEFSVPRAVFDRSAVMNNVQAIMGEVRHIEDGACLGALAGLPQRSAGLACAGRLTVGAALGLIGRLSSERAPPMRLDTVFLSLSDLMHLADRRSLPAGAEEPHRNAFRAGGRTVIGHGRIPAGRAYFTASAHGPELVRGPTVLRCGRERVDIEHYCYALTAHAGQAQHARAGLSVRLVPG